MAPPPTPKTIIHACIGFVGLTIINGEGGEGFMQSQPSELKLKPTAHAEQFALTYP